MSVSDSGWVLDTTNTFLNNSGGPGTVGNGTLTCEYRRFLDGLVAFKVLLVIGSTTTHIGADIFYLPAIFQLPRAYRNDGGFSSVVCVASGTASIGGNLYSASVPVLALEKVSGTGNKGLAQPVFGNNSYMSSTNPATWSSGDFMVFSGTANSFDN